MSIVITLDELRKLAPEADEQILAESIAPLNAYLPMGQITTPSRVAMFLAQFGEETDGFKTMHEYASGREYEGRKDLGNVMPGDGVRFKGRGWPMLTGRANYEFYGKKIGVDLIDNPDKAADPAISIQIAVAYWTEKGLNAWADREDVNHVTYLINGGSNGLARRKQMFAEAQVIFNHSEEMDAAAGPASPAIQPAAAIATGPSDNPWTTPGGVSLGVSAASSAAMAVSGVNGPIAYAIAAVVVIAALAGVFFLIKRFGIGK